MRVRWLVGWGAILGLVACSPALDWREVRPEGMPLVTLFPCKPASHARMLALAGAKVKMTVYACNTAGATWALSFADLEDPMRVTAALQELRSAALANIAATPSPVHEWIVAGATPNAAAGRSELVGRYPDGKAVRMHVGLVASGTSVAQLSVLGKNPGREGVQTFFGGIVVAK